MSKPTENANNGIFQITLNLTLASLISGVILAGTYFITKPFAEKQKVLFRDQTMKELVAGSSGFEPVKGKENWYTANFGSHQTAYIIPSESRGFGGAIKILLAADSNLILIDYKVLSHNETPGLGDRMALTNYRNQFKGKTIENMEVVKSHNPDKIDSMTGATITSRAVTLAVRTGLEELRDYLKKE